MAIARPGSLGDDDGETAATTTTERAAVTTSPPSTSAALTTTSAPTTTAPAGEQPAEGESDTTVASGLAAEGSGSVRAPGEPIADTGGEAMIGLGLALLALGLAARRAVTPA